MDKYQAYKDIFGVPSGRAVLDDLAKAAGAEQTSYREGTDGLGMAFREGKRALYLYILAMIRQANSPIQRVEETEQ